MGDAQERLIEAISDLVHQWILGFFRYAFAWLAPYAAQLTPNWPVVGRVALAFFNAASILIVCHWSFKNLGGTIFRVAKFFCKWLLIAIVVIVPFFILFEWFLDMQ